MFWGGVYMAKVPFHIQTPSLFVLPENIKNSHFKIKCQTLFCCCCCYSFMLDFSVFGIFFSKGKKLTYSLHFQKP